MTKAGLHAQIDAMTDEEAAEAVLIYAPDWPDKVTPIEEIRESDDDPSRHGGGR